MAQQNIVEEGSFSGTVRRQINDNFTDLYNNIPPNSPITVSQSVDVTKTTSTTLQDLPGLVQTFDTGTYSFEIDLSTNATANGGVKVALNATATVSYINAPTTLFTATGDATHRTSGTNSGPAVITITAATAANLRLFLTGTMIITGAGTIQVQGAQNASHSDTTSFYEGSLFTIKKLS